MSSTEDREARQKRRTRRNKIHKPRDNKPGPTAYQLQRDPWSDDYIGHDPHDEDYFQDKELDFEEEQS